MGAHTKQRQRNPRVFLKGKMQPDPSPLMSMVQIKEDMDHCPVPLIYKCANRSPPESGFLRSREDSQMWIVPNHLSVACRVVREQGHFSYSITHYTAWIINHPLSWRGTIEELVHLFRCVGLLMPTRVLVILLAYGGSHHVWNVVCVLTLPLRQHSLDRRNNIQGTDLYTMTATWPPGLTLPLAVIRTMPMG